MPRTYEPRGPHDRAHERVPQQMRYHRSGEHIEFRPCPLRPEVALWPFEGPHGVSWLAARGDTVRLLLPGCAWQRLPSGRLLGTDFALVRFRQEAARDGLELFGGVLGA